jgi:ribosomal peptide maturation radical SAM protein 1
LRAIESVWPGKEIHVADNILPMSFFDHVLPRLAASTPKPKLFYEVKANLKVSQLAAMFAAGIYGVQPGIESLSSPILKLMRKGVTAHQNLALLRDCASVGIQSGWNFIYGFPGETTENYRDVLALLPAISHLMPPKGFSPIMIDRFSPYFDNHSSFGIPSIRPFDSYLGLYPRDAPLGDIAYHFNGDYTTPLLSDADLLNTFRTEVLAWQALWRTPAKRPRLYGEWRPSGSAVIIDTRPIAREHLTVLPPSAANALLHLERPRTLAAIPDFAKGHLDLLLARRFVVDHEGVLVSAVVRKHEARVSDQRTSEALPLAV